MVGGYILEIEPYTNMAQPTIRQSLEENPSGIDILYRTSPFGYSGVESCCSET